MDERITHFIQSIAAQLEGLPEVEIRKAVSFYEEYFNEALEAGQDPEQLIKSLGAPEKIVTMLRTETSLMKAESNPSLRNFSKALRNSFRYVTTPFMVFLLSLVVLISGGLIVAFFGGVVATVTGAMAILIVLIYESVRIPGQFLPEIIGTLGIALFGSGICLLLALGQYKIVQLLIQFSAKLIRLIARKCTARKYSARLSGGSTSEPVQSLNVSQAKSHALTYILLGLTFVGGIMAGVSGLPWEYFIIFNVMRSEAVIQKVEQQYDPGAIEKLSIVTAHSKIRMTRNSGKKIIITYEQPNWLDYEIKSDGSMLSFYEMSNGRLPLFQLVKLHESFTELSISLPERYHPEMISLETTGGPIEISGLAENLTAQTLNREIKFDSTGIVSNFGLKANTKAGQILVNGVSAGQQVSEGIEYYRKTRTTKTPGQVMVELGSTYGNINID
jgi:uncharacterized membrane protein